MEATQHIVKLGPAAVELVDRTMIELARDIPMFRPTVDRFVQGAPEAILLTEFAGDDADDNLRRLRQLVELMGDLGFPDSVIEATDPAFQSAVWNVRKEGLNIMMSMKGDGKPISFIEDCAVRLEDLAEYTDRLTQVFHKHRHQLQHLVRARLGRHCMYAAGAQRSKQELEVKEDARDRRGSLRDGARGRRARIPASYGDRLNALPEFHEPMFGSAASIRAFEEVKDNFDRRRPLRPSKIVRPRKMDDRVALPLPGRIIGKLALSRDRVRLVGLGRLRQRRQDVQQQRGLPPVESDPGVMC